MAESQGLVQTGSGGRGVAPSPLSSANGGSVPWGRKLTTHFSLMQNLMSGALSPLPYIHSRCAQGQLDLYLPYVCLAGFQDRFPLIMELYLVLTRA